MLGRAGRASQGTETCCVMTLLSQGAAAPVGWVLPDLYWEGAMKENWYWIYSLLATPSPGFFPKGMDFCRAKQRVGTVRGAGRRQSCWEMARRSLNGAEHNTARTPEINQVEGRQRVTRRNCCKAVFSG